MRIALVNPNYPTFFHNKRNNVLMYNRPLQPICLATIASMLRDRNDVEIIDANVEKLSSDELREQLASGKPDVVCVTSSPIDRWQCPFPDYSPAIEAVESAHSAAPDSFIILTGPHATSRPEEVLRQTGFVDVAVRGEPEQTVLEIVRKLESRSMWENVAGISYVRKGILVSNPPRDYLQDLDELPIPAYDLLPMKKYRYEFLETKGAFSLMLTSRGCPYSCAFCYLPMYGHKFRVRSLDIVMQEIELLYRTFSVRSIYFLDLNFTFDKGRAKQLCERMISAGYDVSWGCTTRVDAVDESLLNCMRRAGCKVISYGVETSDLQILKTIGKGISPDEVRSVVKQTKNAGIEADLNFLIGLPGDSAEKIESSWRFYKDLDPYSIGSTLVLPYPETRLYEMAKGMGMVREGTWKETADLAGLVGNDCTPKSVKKLMARQSIRARSWYFQKEYGTYYLVNPRFVKWILGTGKRLTTDMVQALMDYLKIRKLTRAARLRSPSDHCWPDNPHLRPSQNESGQRPVALEEES